jgi:WD40 repeat protein
MLPNPIKTVMTVLFAAALSPCAHAGGPHRDLHGDPLPEGAIARLGTVRMRHAHLITGAAFAPDGKSILVSDDNSGVHVWDVAEGKELRHFFKNAYSCRHLTLSPDGRTLAVALDGEVRLCDPISGREFGALPKDPLGINEMAFSHDGSRLATTTGYKSVKIWDAATRRLLRELTLPANVGKLAFSPDGKLLACSTWDGHCRLWDLARDREVRRLGNEPAGKDSLYAIFAPGGGLMAVWGYEDRSVRLFDAGGAREIRRFKVEGTVKRKPGPWGWVPEIHASFSPGGKILAIFRAAGGIELWEVESGKKLHTLVCGGSHKPSYLRFSPDGARLASAGGDFWNGDNIVRVWDVARGKGLLPFTGHSAPITSVAISPDGNTVATAGRDGIVHLWDRSIGKPLLRLEGDRGRHPRASFSSDGRRVIGWGAYEEENTLRIWDSRTGQAVRRPEPPRPGAFWTAASDDGKTAISVDPKRQSIRLHDLTTGKVTHEVKVANAASNWPILLSPAGDKMVSRDGNLSNVHLRNVADSKMLLHIGRVYFVNPSVSFSADGRRLVAAVVANSPDKGLLVDPPAEEIAVIDPIQGKELRRFGKSIEKFRPIDAAALSQDGKMVITAAVSADNPAEQVITLWETDTGRARGHFLGHRGRVQRIAISADGRFVVTGGDDTTALIWDATRPRTRKSLLLRESPATDLQTHFRHLAGKDAEQAYASRWALQSAPQKAVSFLGQQRDLFARADVRRIQRWIEDLDSDEFAEREQAYQELGWILDEAEPHLKKALRGGPSLEMRCRIDLLLRERRSGPTGHELRRLRVIEILEHIAAPGASAVLEKLAAGAPEARPTQEAKAALGRLEERTLPLLCACDSPRKVRRGP